MANIFLLFFLVSLSWAQTLPRAKPEEVGMSSSRLFGVRAAIEDAVSRKDFPGAVLLVARKGKIVLREAFGENQWVPEQKLMDVSLLFDLASLTKPIATATAIMMLVEQGKISLRDKVKDYVPDFVPYPDKDESKSEDIRIWHLLTHTSGLPPICDAAEVEAKYGNPVPIASMAKHIAQLPKTDPPGKAFHYSCLGYITLGYIVEKVAGKTLAEYSEENIFRPLGMMQTVFAPSKEMRKSCVPTEVVDGQPLQGVVHDPRARLLAGVSGNAGLFSTADDLAVFAQMMLNKGRFRGIQILSPLTVERMTQVFPEAGFAGRGLGWDLDSSYSTNGGDLFGLHSYGHSGYTGTSIWIDPDTETFVIFLTNRVHPDDKGAIVSLRSRIANIVAASIVDIK